MEQGTSINPEFSDVGFSNIEDGVEMFRLFNVSDTTLKNPIEWQMLKEIASFTNAFQDGAGIIRRVVTNKKADIPNLTHAFNYITLRRNIMETEQSLSKLKEEATLYE